MFCKKPVVFCGVFVVAFCLGIDVATALCNRYNPVGPGKYCQHTVEYTCPKNCYCKGTTKGEKLSITWADGVSKGCSNRWSKVDSELCNDRYGVCLCPADFPKSDAGAASSSKCYYNNSNGHKLYYKDYKCNAGQYLPADSDTCQACPKNYYCKGISTKPSKKDAGKEKCPTGYISEMGAKSSSDCKNTIYCPGGQYLPASITQCSSCPNHHACPGGEYTLGKNYVQGSKKCEDGTEPNSDKTACVTKEPEYIECFAGEYAVVKSDASKCVKCRGDNNVCPGGKWEKTIGEHGLEECKGNTKPNADQTACEGITVTCQAGEYIPANSIECTKCKDAAEAAGKLCKGGTLTPSNTEAVGLSTCSGTMVPNPDHTNCVAPPPDSYECGAGQYLPKNTKECAPCPEKHTCGGGTFVFNETTDQGAVPVKEYAIPNDVLAYGEHDKDAPLKDHCWYIANPDKYKECVMKGIQKIIDADNNSSEDSDENTDSSSDDNTDDSE